MTFTPDLNIIHMEEDARNSFFYRKLLEMKNPNWFIDENRLFRVKEVIQETKKTLVLRIEGLKGIRQLKKNDIRLRYRKRKPMF